MKTVKFFSITMLLAMVAFTLTACGGDDDESDDNGEGYNSSTRFSTEYVDLGLSVKWATCNLGATKPGEFGNYYAWGETSPKSCYNWDAYKWYVDSDQAFTKYCTNIEYSHNGYIDRKAVLTPEDDAATVNLGKKWRIPTSAELEELVNECTWTEITQKGVRGYQVTGPNGKSIFLPRTGYYYGTEFVIDTDPYSSDNVGLYWSASLDKEHNLYARGLDINFNHNTIMII